MLADIVGSINGIGGVRSTIDGAEIVGLTFLLKLKSSASFAID